jgi:hypothetical protein
MSPQVFAKTDEFMWTRFWSSLHFFDDCLVTRWFVIGCGAFSLSPGALYESSCFRISGIRSGFKVIDGTGVSVWGDGGVGVSICVTSE